jgi:SAM-dependent methyltransferase
LKSFDRFEDSYESELEDVVRFSGQDADFFTRAKAHALCDLTWRHIGDPAELSVLDVGCAVGLTDTFLTPAFGRVAGVDISAPLVERAEARNPDASYAVYAGDRLPYEDGSFDVVFAFCVLHHVPVAERAAFVKEMHRVTSRRGIAVVGEHNPLNPLTRLVVSRCAFDEDAMLLGAREVNRLFEMARLRPVERRYILIAPWDVPLVRRVEQLLSPLPLGAQYLSTGSPV